MSKFLVKKSADPELQACLDAWNAKERVRVAAEDAVKAARAATPVAQARAAANKAYRAANKKRVAQLAREARTKARMEHRLAKYRLDYPHGPQTEEQRALIRWNNAQLLT